MDQITTKQKVLEILSSSGTAFISGQQIADRLFVTRAAVWKAVSALKKSGFEIEAVTNKGYRLKYAFRLPDREAINEYLAGVNASFDLYIYDSVTSTNDAAKELNASGRDAVIIAGSQSAGRGRRGRPFFSPEGTGMYISFLLHPDMELQKASLLTCMTAVAVCRAIRKCLGIECSVKWVNDIYLGEKKICGILTEGEASVEDNRFSHVIIGAGINLYAPKEGFPDGLKDLAGCLLTSAVDETAKDRLYAAVIREFFELYESGSDFLDEYRSRSNLIGRYVKISKYSGNTKDPGSAYALVTGIDDNCRLLVRYDSGRTDALASGEVSTEKY